MVLFRGALFIEKPFSSKFFDVKIVQSESIY